MEKIVYPVREEYPSVKLYFDDLEKILDLLREENFSEIKLKTQSHIYEGDEVFTVTEIGTLKQISARNPFLMWIDFDDTFRSGVKIYCEQDSAIAEGIIKKIGKILNLRKRPGNYIFSKVWLLYVLYLILQLIFGYLNAKHFLSSWLYLCIFLLTSIIYILVGVCDHYKIFKRNVFYSFRKKDVPNFWLRNRDQIVVNLVVGVIVAIISSVCTILITKNN